MSQVSEDKRSLPRLLCDEYFSDCRVEIQGEVYKVTSVNFHHRGMALFCANRLPQFKQALLSFEYNSPDLQVTIRNLEFNLTHALDMDVGSQYGVAFNQDSLRNTQVEQNLKAIEQRLSINDPGPDRYGLFEV